MSEEGKGFLGNPSPCVSGCDEGFPVSQLPLMQRFLDSLTGYDR